MRVFVVTTDKVSSKVVRVWSTADAAYRDAEKRNGELKTYRSEYNDMKVVPCEVDAEYDFDMVVQGDV